MAHHASRWASLTVGMLVMLCAGTVYGFGAIRATLKHRLNADESQMGMVALLGNLGLWSGSAMGGMLLDAFGPRPGMLAGGAFQLLGYVLFSVTLGGPDSSDIPNWASPMVSSLAWLLCGLGCGFLYNTAMFTNAGNFPAERRGLVIGLMATVFGLSPATCIIFLEGCIGGWYQEQTCENGFPNNDLASYALVLAVVVVVLSCSAAAFSRQLKPEEVADEEVHSSAHGQLWALLAAAVCFLLWTTALSLMLAVPAVMSSVGTWAPLTLPIFGVALVYLQWRGKQVNADDCVEIAQRSEPLTIFQQGLGPSTTASRAASITLFAAFHMTEFWLLFYAMACIIGTNVATMNITSTIVKDRHIGNESVADMVQVITNSTSALFRCVGGMALFFAPRMPRFLPLIVAGCISVISQLLYASGINGLAYLAAVSVGVSDGVVWTSLPWLAGLIFGVKHVGSIFGCLVLLASTGVLLMGNLVEPFVYNSHAESSGDECYGTQCFFLFHIVAASVSLSGAIAAVLLHSLSNSRKRNMTRAC